MSIKALVEKGKKAKGYVQVYSLLTLFPLIWLLVFLEVFSHWVKVAWNQAIEEVSAAHTETLQGWRRKRDRIREMVER